MVTISPALTVAVTALSRVKTMFTTPLTTPPRILAAVQRIPPRNPPPQVGGALYCMITLTLVDEFASSGRRSGEIFEVSAKAVPATMNAHHRTAHRETCLAYRA